MSKTAGNPRIFLRSKMVRLLYLRHGQGASHSGDPLAGRTGADGGSLSSRFRTGRRLSRVATAASRRRRRRTPAASRAMAATRRDARRRTPTTASTGLADPSYAGRWEKGCGRCHLPPGRARAQQPDVHQRRHDRADPGHLGGRARQRGLRRARRAPHDARRDEPLAHTSVLALDNLSGDLYRKFCARCHVARQNDAARRRRPRRRLRGLPLSRTAMSASYQGGDPP